MRVGFAPITWNNEDLLDLRPPTPYERVLDEVAAAGYEGTELGLGFPEDAAVLGRALAARGLAIPSAWCGLNLVDEAAEAADLACAERRARLVSRLGGHYLNVAHAGTPETLAVAGRAGELGRRLPEAAWTRLARRCQAVGRIARDHGLRAAFHQHAGTFVETRDEVEELAQRVDAEVVGWCFDVGHAVYGGIDPIDFIGAHGRRIDYVHLKDVDGAALARLRRERGGWEAGLRSYVFTELGRGALDLGGVIEALRGAGYDGWLMVEQDTSALDPAESARIARAALRAIGL